MGNLIFSRREDGGELKAKTRLRSVEARSRTENKKSGTTFWGGG